MAVRRDLDIPGLEITMQDRGFAGVEIGERVADRRADQNRFIFRDVA